MVQVMEKTFMVVGEQNRGFFKEYAQTVPIAAQLFLKRESEIPFSSGVEVTVYEPPKQKNQLEGIFYVGVLVDQKVTDVPEGMDFIVIEHQYAMITGKVTEISNLYSQVDQWISENNYQHATSDNNIIEVYFSIENDVEAVEVYIPFVI